MFNVAAQREAILNAPLETSNFGETPDLATLYIPSSHLKALRLDSSIVIGGRGVGKSFWTAALESNEIRALLKPDLQELDGLELHTGFSARPSLNYPDADTFRALLSKQFTPYDIWRTIIFHLVTNQKFTSWPEIVLWFRENPETVNRIMLEFDRRRALIVFDALDRTSDDWRQMDDIVRDLLRAVLWSKSYKGLFVKVFLRDDQAERTVFDFPDASKLSANKANLTWMRHDLHGLLWQRLIHSRKYAELMREICNAENDQQNSTLWRLPLDMKRESDVQRKAFEKLAGPWMGKDKRRGVPYVWAVGHLADGWGKTSPRSFLAAIHQAAENSQTKYPDHAYALHYESIKLGIQKASEIRVDELAEDYPWIREVLSALQSQNVPCVYEDILARWRIKFPQGADSIPRKEKLPAQHSDQGWDGIRKDLQRLGLIEERKDGRIDMPDLFRVGFNLGRKGGVSPKKK